MSSAHWVLLFAAGSFLLGCGDNPLDPCYEEHRSTATLAVAEGEKCPSQDTAEDRFDDSVRDVEGPATIQHLSGQATCSYEVAVHQRALDEVVDGSYDAVSRQGSPCDSLEACHCLSRADAAYLSSPTLRLPDGSTLVDVVSGPVYEYYGTCRYRVHIRRLARTTQEHRYANTVHWATGPARSEGCSPASLLITDDRDERVTKIVSGPTLEAIVLPQEQCTYPVIGGTKVFLCGGG